MARRKVPCDVVRVIMPSGKEYECVPEVFRRLIMSAAGHLRMHVRAHGGMFINSTEGEALRFAETLRQADMTVAH